MSDPTRSADRRRERATTVADADPTATLLATIADHPGVVMISLDRVNAGTAWRCSCAGITGRVIVSGAGPTARAAVESLANLLDTST